MDLILRKLAAGESREQVLGDYRTLTAPDVDAVLAYAAAVIAGERLVAAE